jgi:hypothetical protein
MKATIDRIMVYRKHHLVPINHVNPIYINNLEQIHRVVGSPFPFVAIPTNHDPLYPGTPVFNCDRVRIVTLPVSGGQADAGVIERKG